MARMVTKYYSWERETPRKHFTVHIIKIVVKKHYNQGKPQLVFLFVIRDLQQSNIVSAMGVMLHAYEAVG